MNLCRRVTHSSWRKKTLPLEEEQLPPLPFREPEENQVWQALTSLEESYRLPLYLFYFQELSTRRSPTPSPCGLGRCVCACPVVGNSSAPC